MRFKFRNILSLLLPYLTVLWSKCFPLLYQTHKTGEREQSFNSCGTPVSKAVNCTNDCTSRDASVKLLKFADDTTLIGLIQDGDESANRQEVKELAVWCSLAQNCGDDRGLQEKPPCSPPTHHHEQLCDCSQVI